MAKKRLRTEERRAQITEAALVLLAKKGASGLTLVELGQAVGITDASVLRHFKDKRAIVEAAIERFGALLDEDLPEDIEAPMRRLGVFVVRRLAKIRARPELMALAHNARLRDVAGEDAALVDQHVGRSVRFLRSCVEEAQRAGEISEAVPTQMWVWLVTGLLRGAAAQLPTLLLDDTGEELPISPERAWELLEGVLRK